jgi:hypothetical protein
MIKLETLQLKYRFSALCRRKKRSPSLSAYPLFTLIRAFCSVVRALEYE